MIWVDAFRIVAFVENTNALRNSAPPLFIHPPVGTYQPAFAIDVNIPMTKRYMACYIPTKS